MHSRWVGRAPPSNGCCSNLSVQIQQLEIQYSKATLSLQRVTVNITPHLSINSGWTLTFLITFDDCSNKMSAVCWVKCNVQLLMAKAGRSHGNDDEVGTFNLTVFQIFYWTVGKVWKLIPLKEGSLKVHTLKKIFAACSAAKLLHIFSRRASRGAAVPIHFKFASYAYDFRNSSMHTASRKLSLMVSTG